MNYLRRVILGTFLVVALTAPLGWSQEEEQGPPPPPNQADAQVTQQPPDQQPSSQPPNQPTMDQRTPQPPDSSSRGSQDNQPDPPSRVARVQYVTGSVSIQPHGTDQWVGASVNRPLTTNDNVWTDKDSKAELNAGTGVLRMNSESSLTLLNVGDNSTQVELHQGTLNLRVRHLFNGEIYEVDTPNMAFTVQKTGEYRFDVDPNGDASVVTVWKGEGDATGNGPSVRVKSHQRARFTAGNSMAHEISEAPGLDGFDDWARVRDQREDHSISAQYVAPGVIGYEDLDAYGSWRQIAPYGAVWVPSGVSVGWAPYHFGHWVWISPWGWTWVDDEPWGFAPYHYGRWVYGGGFWGWAPGGYYGRPYYAPALVAWFGGSGWGAGFGFGFGGGIGWCPLGWGEPFFPWYRGSWGYFNRINIYNTRITNINRFGGFYHGGRFEGTSFAYSNLRAPGGTFAVSQRTFVNSLPVRGAGVQVSAREFQGASLSGRLPVTPERTSMLGANAGRATSMPPSRSFARPVVSKMTPPAGMHTGGAGMAGVNSTARLAQGQFGGPGQSNVGLSNRSVPRPPQSASIANEARSNVSVPQAGARSVPRPPANTMSAPRGGYSSPGRSAAPSAPRSTQDSGRGRSMNNVPRPTGAVQPASNYAGGSGGASSSAGWRGSYGASSRSYGESSRYSAPAPSWRGYNSAPSYSAPANHGYSGGYSGGGYGASSRGYSGGSYGGSNRGYSAPSARAAAPSYHGSGGGGGSRSSGGGGRSSGGHGR
jgi:hypothetical protein